LSGVASERLSRTNRVTARRPRPYDLSRALVETPHSRTVAPHLAILSVGYVTFAYAAMPDVVRVRYGVPFAALGLDESRA